ncbi:MAG: hypothetical protein ACI9DJ_002243 [Algoriphagus sp.]|jgi:hypothetical protein
MKNTLRWGIIIDPTISTLGKFEIPALYLGSGESVTRR